MAQELGSQTVDLLHLEMRFADLPDLLTQLENCKVFHIIFQMIVKLLELELDSLLDVEYHLRY